MKLCSSRFLRPVGCPRAVSSLRGFRCCLCTARAAWHAIKDVESLRIAVLCFSVHIAVPPCPENPAWLVFRPLFPLLLPPNPLLLSPEPPPRPCRLHPSFAVAGLPQERYVHSHLQRGERGRIPVLPRGEENQEHPQPGQVAALPGKSAGPFSVAWQKHASQVL